MDMARLKSFMLGGSPIVSKFEFDNSVIHSTKLRVKVFNEYSEEWLILSLPTEKVGTLKTTISSSALLRTTRLAFKSENLKTVLSIKLNL